MRPVENLILHWKQKARPHQAAWFAERHRPYRNYLVDRQIGTSYAMAVEAAIVQRETGRVQVLLAATKAQAEISRDCISHFFDKADINRSALRFESPESLLRKLPTVPFDLYVADYAWLSWFALEKLNKAIVTVTPTRLTWTTTGTGSLIERLLLDATRFSQSP